MMEPGKKIYFLSDFHLGIPDASSSLEREKKIVRFLEMAAKDAEEVLLLGDLFDFWFEYRRAVPRGHVRLLGKLAELTDGGLPVHLFIGNHDMWIFDYIPSETGVIVHHAPVVRTWNDKKFLIAHGDGLGPGDHGYKFIKKVFRNRFSQWLFARLHPNLGIGMANFWSGRSRSKNFENDKNWLGEEKEWLVGYCRDRLKTEHFDLMVFGHRHLPVDMEVAHGTRYINLGDWIGYFTYAVFDGRELLLKQYSGRDDLRDDPVLKGAPAQSLVAG